MIPARNQLKLPPGIDDERTRALLELLEVRFGALPVERVLVYHMGAVPDAALPALGWQFDLPSAAAWTSGDPDARRALIATAIERQRTRGTIGSTVRALGAIDAPPVVVQRFTRLLADGSVRADGTFTASGGSGIYWLVFATEMGFTAPQRATYESVAREWMRGGAHLRGVFYVDSLDDVDDVSTYESDTTVTVPLGAVSSPDGAQILLPFAHSLDESSVPEPGAFSLAGTPAAVIGVQVLDSQCVLTLSEAVAESETLSLDYTPGALPLRSRRTHNEASAFTALPVDNLSTMLLPQRFAPSLWMRADDAGATVVSAPVLDVDFSNPLAVIASGNYASVPNAGSLGGSIVPATGTGPQRVAVGSEFGALTTTNGGVTIGDENSFRALHEPKTSATLHVRFRLDTPATGGRIFTTRNGTAGLIGVFLEILGSTLRFTVGDGSTNTLTLTSAATLAAGVHEVIIYKSDRAFVVMLDGVAYFLGTATNLAAGASQTKAQIGSSLTDTGNFAGALLSLSVRPYDTRVATGTFSAFPNRGSQSGAFDPASGVGPERRVAGGRTFARTTATGGLRFVTAPHLRTLHEPGTNATLSMLLDVEAVAATTTLFTTRFVGGDLLGCRLHFTAAGALTLSIGNGSSTTLISAPNGTITVGEREIDIVKVNDLFSLYVDGALVASGAATLAAGAPQTAAFFGGLSNDVELLTGALGQILYVQRALSGAERAALRTYYASW